jgi:hypothetical protein
VSIQRRQQFARCDLETLRECEQRDESGVALTSLNRADIRTVKATPMSELLLRQALFVPERCQERPNRRKVLSRVATRRAKPLDDYASTDYEYH